MFVGKNETVSTHKYTLLAEKSVKLKRRGEEEIMEVPSDPNKITKDVSKTKGGFRTMPFIIANEAFEKVASYGLLPNMILYLINEYHMKLTTGQYVLSLWSAFTNFLPIVGAFISDSYLGQYRTIALGSFASLLGMTLLWLTAMIPQAKPPKCPPHSHTCESSSSAQLALLFASFVLMSIGAGGIRPCSLAFGAEQFDKKENPNNEKVLQSFFNWYYASAAVSVLIAMSVIVYIQDHLGWKIGFGIPAILMLLSAFLFVFASSYYIKANADKSLFTGLAQVIVVAFKNRRLPHPQKDTEDCYYHIKGSRRFVPSQKLSFLNKACIITNFEKDLDHDPWSLCTVDQVEDLKTVFKVIPIWSTGIMLMISLSTPGFPILQANSMDRHITSHFQIPAGSFALFTIGALTIWIAIYDRLVIPLLAKLTGRPYGLGLKQRMGIGLIFSILACATAAIVESIRRKTAIQQGFSDNPQGIVTMSAMWLVPQHCLNGLAEAFNAVGQTEFYYSEFPKSMSSIAAALFGLGMAFANLIVGLLVKIVDDATKSGGKGSWVASNLNKARYDYYYWLLVVLGTVNFIYYLGCCWAFGPCERERVRDLKEGEEMKEEALSKPKELSA